MKLSLNQPGFILSALIHVAVLLVLVLGFADTKKFEDAQESIAVEVLSESQANDIMKGDKTSKEVKPMPKPKVEKLAETEVSKPAPPTPDAKRDVPTPPPELKRRPDPGEDDAPAAEPVKPEPAKVEIPKVEPPKPAPKPPELAKPVPAPPAAPPIPPEPPKAEAEIVRPPPPQKQELTKLIDQTLPEPPKAEPPKPAEKPLPNRPATKAEPPKPAPKFDEVAKLLDQKKREDLTKTANQPASKPKSGEEKAAPTHNFNVADINKLLSKEQTQAQASTGRQLSPTATAGTTTANSDKMSPSLSAQLNGYLKDKYHMCWNLPITLPTGAKYVPMIRVTFNPDGSLALPPQLTNPPSDAAFNPLAKSAMDAVKTPECNPMKIPPHFQAFYEEWKNSVISFDPEDQ